MGAVKYLYSVIATFLTLLPSVLSAGIFWGFEDARKEFHGLVWEADLPDFGVGSYRVSVEALITAFEEKRGEPLRPGRQGRVGLKIYTHSGPGLKTPPALTLAVAEALERRGFSRGDLFIFDTRESNLRAAGYLPPLSERHRGDVFEGIPVKHLDSPELRDPLWHYDSPLPEEFTTPLGRELLRPTREQDAQVTRRSYLASPLIKDVDFWINLPVAVDQFALGFSGVMVNASLWNITNSLRFFGSPVNAPVAVAEINAIPELLDTWAFTILTLESFQYIGGPAFNANYTASEPILWLGVDPVIMDALLLRRINEGRQQRGFRTLGTLLPYMDYGVNFGLGRALESQAIIKKVTP